VLKSVLQNAKDFSLEVGEKPALLVKIDDIAY
jgi:hypothetical protein